MPLLAEETSLSPDNLLTDMQVQNGRNWLAVYTRSRQEKAVARQFLTDQVPFYLPTIPKEHLFRGRRMTSFVPLFSGYVFCFVNDEEHNRCFRAGNRISRVLKVNDGPQLVHDLTNLRQLIASGAPLTVESRLQIGQPVRIKSGALTGLEGYVLRRRGNSFLFVAVDFLQQGVSVKIEDFLVEPM